MKPILFKSTRYANLRVSLGGGRYAEFSDYEYLADDETMVRALVSAPGYGSGYITPSGVYTVDIDGKLINVMTDYARDAAKYPPSCVKEVSIIIGTHHNPECLKECLDSLYKHTRPGYELIIVDNQTDEKSKAIIREYKKLLKDDCKVIHNKENRGFSEFNNQGVAISTRPLILFLNDDTVLRPLWLSSMVYLLKTVPRCGIVGKRSHNAKQQPQYHCESFISGEEDVAFAFCMLVRKEDATFDEKNFPGYGWEDIDLCTQVRHKGKRIFIERNYPIIHKGSVSTDRIENKSKVFGINQKNYNIKWNTNINHEFITKLPDGV